MNSSSPNTSTAGGDSSGERRIEDQVRLRPGGQKNEPFEALKKLVTKKYEALDDAPSDLVKPLLKHQKEWLAWALKQEEGPIRGGILADETGMGKTIEAIALVLAKREINRKTHDDTSSLASTSSTGLPRIEATLVVCPTVAVTHWVNEIDEFTAKGSTKVLIHHGPQREGSSGTFSSFDFVITTYGIVESEYRLSKKSSCGEGSCETKNKPKKPREKILHSVNWNRIILDEALIIKDRRSSRTEAIFALESSYKWALTGTPLQNLVGDLYSLVRFLQVVPYSFYLCSQCDCRSLEYRPSKACSNCPHGSCRHFSWWHKYIEKPIRRHGNHGKGAPVLVSQKVLKEISLRRTTNDKATLLFPPKIVTLRVDALDDEEQKFYGSLYSDCRAQFNRYVGAEYPVTNYKHRFDLLTRLRQAADHRYLVLYPKTKSLRNMLDTAQVERMCGLGSVPEDLLVAPCANADQTFETANMGFKSSSILNRIELNGFQTSTKIEALREEIRFMVERDGSAKGIVFSQFVSFLDLINYSLQKSGVRCVQLDGSMTLAARDAVIKKFTDDPDCKILLMSLKAGVVALNLTMASHVFVMDPCWNPAVEKRAVDMVSRIGQYKTTRIVKFIMEKTVEQKIVILREWKKRAGKSKALRKLSLHDIGLLFTKGDVLYNNLNRL